MATIDEIVEILKEHFSDLEIALFAEHAGEPYILVPVEAIEEVMRFLRHDEHLQFNSLIDLCGVDYPPEHIAVVYHLHSLSLFHRVKVKVHAPRENGKVPSVSTIWGLADWMEREVYDLLGVNFSGHPDLRRLLLPPDWVGHPLRKDYQEQEAYNGIPTVRPTEPGK